MTYLAEVLADNPTWYWPLDDLQGGVAFNSGTNQETISGVGDFFGGWRGIRTSGYSCYCGGNTSGRLRDRKTRNYVPPPATLEIWVWFALDGTVETVVVANSVNIGISIGKDIANTVTFYVGNGSTYITRTSAALSLRSWHHLVVAITTALMTCYVDGVAIGSNAVVPSSGNPGLGLTWGANDAGVNPMTGFFAEPAIYPSTLSAGRVLAHYDAANLKAFPPVYLPLAGFTTIDEISADMTGVEADLDEIKAAVIGTYS